MPTAYRLTLLLAVVTACVPDGWVTVPPKDASSDANTDAAGDAMGDATEDDGGAPCGAGQMRCGARCVAGPTALYRGEDNADDATGALDADGAMARYGAGRFGRGFAFEGDNAPRYIALPTRVGDLGAGDFSLSLWFQSAYTVGNQTMLARRAACWNGPSFTGFDIRLAHTGRLYVELWTSLGQFVLTSPTGLNDGRWHHLAIVREDATARLHVDGAEVAARALPGSMNDPQATPTYLGVGRCVGGAPGSNGTHDDTHWFAGHLDAVAFFARALTRSELDAAALGHCAR